jgi:hypothetical protein
MVFLQDTKLNYISQPSLQPGGISYEFWPGMLAGMLGRAAERPGPQKHLMAFSTLSLPPAWILEWAHEARLQGGFMGRVALGCSVAVCVELQVCITMPLLYCAGNGTHGFKHAREVSYQLSPSPNLASGLLRPFSFTRGQSPASDLGCGIVVGSSLCIYHEVKCSSWTPCEVKAAIQAEGLGKQPGRITPFAPEGPPSAPPAYELSSIPGSTLWKKNADTFTLFSDLYTGTGVYMNMHKHIHIYAYIHTYIYTHTHTYTHTYIYMHICTYTHMYLYKHTHTYMYIYIYVCIYTYKCVYMYIYTYMLIHAYTCIYAYICIYKCT